MFHETMVETTDFYRGQQEPRRFLYKNAWWDIVDIEDRWYEGYIRATDVPQRYFRVRTAKGYRFILRYNELFGIWSVKELGF